MKIISISGLDGSGKSTQIELLKNYFESQGKKVFYFHAVQFSIANKYLRHSERSEESQNITAGDIGTGSFVATQNDKKTKSVTRANWIQIQLRKLALFIDVFRFKKLCKNLEAEGYDYMLSDRYFYDNLINISYLQNSSLPPKTYNMIPAPDFAFYLSTDPESIMKRERPADQGLEYLQKKKILLDKFSQEKNLTIINGNREQNIVHSEILSIILN